MTIKKGVLIPSELSVLDACLDLRTHGAEEVHGLLVAKQIGERAGEDAHAFRTNTRARDDIRRFWRENRQVASHCNYAGALLI